MPGSERRSHAAACPPVKADEPASFAFVTGFRDRDVQNPDAPAGREMRLAAPKQFKAMGGTQIGSPLRCTSDAQRFEYLIEGQQPRPRTSRRSG